MVNVINYSLNDNQIAAIQNVVSQNYNIINPTMIYGICKPASHLAYYIKELYEYIVRIGDVDLQSLYVYRILKDEKKICEKLKK